MDPDPAATVRGGRGDAVTPSMHVVTSRDDLRLMVREWLPARPEKGVLCLLHGHGEHGGQHEVLARPLAEAGFAVLAMDLRGHGLSEGKRGHTPSYGHFLDDLDVLLEHAAQRFPGTLRFVYGHSLGGNIALNHALRRPNPDLSGIITTCPWLRLTHEISRLRVFLASLVRPFWPSFSVSTSVDLPKLVSGPMAEGVNTSDPLLHDRITMEAFLSVRRAGVWAVEHANQL
ncbi:MAG: alpha/beta fold hydrolase, partial [Dehalococcoidia bacterium]